jgi:hypothetical protein
MPEGYVGFEVLMPLSIKSIVFLVTPCSLELTDVSAHRAAPSSPCILLHSDHCQNIKSNMSHRRSLSFDITASSPLKANRRFGGICRRLHLRCLIVKQTGKQRETDDKQSSGSEDWGDLFLPKRRLPSSVLQDVTSQRIEPFITTSVKIRNACHIVCDFVATRYNVRWCTLVQASGLRTQNIWR